LHFVSRDHPMAAAGDPGEVVSVFFLVFF
jgi:hypothetical protein